MGRRLFETKERLAVGIHISYWYWRLADIGIAWYWFWLFLLAIGPLPLPLPSRHNEQEVYLITSRILLAVNQFNIVSFHVTTRRMLLLESTSGI